MSVGSTLLLQFMEMILRLLEVGYLNSVKTVV